MYTVVHKCMDCETVLRTKEVSEESFFAIAERTMHKNDLLGDEAGAVLEDKVVLYDSLCSNCEDPIQDLNDESEESYQIYRAHMLSTCSQCGDDLPGGGVCAECNSYWD